MHVFILYKFKNCLNLCVRIIKNYIYLMKERGSGCIEFKKEANDSQYTYDIDPSYGIGPSLCYSGFLQRRQHIEPFEKSL